MSVMRKCKKKKKENPLKNYIIPKLDVINFIFNEINIRKFTTWVCKKRKKYRIKI